MDTIGRACLGRASSAEQLLRQPKDAGKDADKNPSTRKKATIPPGSSNDTKAPEKAEPASKRKRRVKEEPPKSPPNPKSLPASPEKPQPKQPMGKPAGPLAICAPPAKKPAATAPPAKTSKPADDPDKTKDFTQTLATLMDDDDQDHEEGEGETENGDDYDDDDENVEPPPSKKPASKGSPKKAARPKIKAKASPKKRAQTRRNATPKSAAKASPNSKAKAVAKPASPPAKSPKKQTPTKGNEGQSAKEAEKAKNDSEKDAEKAKKESEAALDRKKNAHRLYMQFWRNIHQCASLSFKQKIIDPPVLNSLGRQTPREVKTLYDRFKYCIHLRHPDCCFTFAGLKPFQFIMRQVAAAGVVRGLSENWRGLEERNCLARDHSEDIQQNTWGSKMAYPKAVGGSLWWLQKDSWCYHWSKEDHTWAIGEWSSRSSRATRLAMIYAYVSLCVYCIDSQRFRNYFYSMARPKYLLALCQVLNSTWHWWRTLRWLKQRIRL